jgi:Cu(I)/Ag(I) efflux system periplasmic protein CusF
MKRIALVLSVTLLAASALAQSDMKGMDMKPGKSDVKGAVHKATGVVTKLDPAKSKVTIRHGPVQTLNWPAMTMAFTVRDKPTLEKLKKDQKIDFEFVQQGKDYVLTSVR